MKHSSFTPAGGAALFTGKYEINNVCSLPSPEGFEIELFSDGSAVLFAAAPRAEKYALSQAKKMTGKELPCGKYAFVPEFAVRGIIEGFYGNPWTVDERRRLLSALSDRGMNSYFYGPKDDPFHRDRWDELYGENDADMLRHCAIGIAMGNSCKEAMEAADYVTEDIDTDGIWLALKHYEII